MYKLCKGRNLINSQRGQQKTLFTEEHSQIDSRFLVRNNANQEIVSSIFKLLKEKKNKNKNKYL